ATERVASRPFARRSPREPWLGGAASAPAFAPARAPCWRRTLTSSAREPGLRTCFPASRQHPRKANEKLTIRVIARVRAGQHESGRPRDVPPSTSDPPTAPGAEQTGATRFGSTAGIAAWHTEGRGSNPRNAGAP